MIKKIINTFTSNIAIAAFNLLIAVLVSQYLGASGKGQQSIIITNIAFILLICNIAGGASLVYLVPRYNNLKIIYPAYVWSLLVCSIVYFALKTHATLSGTYLFHVCLLTFMASIIAINSMILLGNEKIKEKNIISVTQTLVVVILLFILFIILKKKDISSYITALYISYSIALILSFIYLNKYINRHPHKSSLRNLLKDMFKYGILNQLGHITQLLSIRLSYYILLVLLGDAEVGIYSNAVSLAEAVWLVSKSIATVQYARIANSDDDIYARKISIKLMKASLVVCFVLLIPLVLLPSNFFTFVFGKDFSSVSTVILILAPGILIYNLAIIFGHYFSGRGHYHINILTAFVGLVSNVSLCWLLIPKSGITGAALASSVSFFVMSFLSLIIFYKKSNMKLHDFWYNVNDLEELKSIVKQYRITKNE